MKADEFRLTSWALWLGFAIYGGIVYPLWHGAEANAAPGFPLALNQGSMTLLFSYAYVFLAGHLMGAFGRAEKNDIKMLALLLILTLLLSITYWQNPRPVIQWFIIILVGLALEYYRPNWIWEVRRRTRRKST